MRDKKKIFIDCGFHLGEGLTQFCQILQIDETWAVYAFEPNPECRMPERISSFSHIRDLNLIPKAVWVRDGLVFFRQENHRKSGSGSPHDHRSDCDGWASSIAELHAEWPGLEEPIQVPCVDFSRFIQILWLHAFEGCEIYCKMDIEGSEFPVLRKMIADGTIKHIKKIWVEFHDCFLPSETEETRDKLIEEISKYTEVELWH